MRAEGWRGPLRLVHAALVAGTLSFIGLYLTARTGGIATIWPANAAVVALAWLAPPRDRWWIVAGAPLGIFATHLILDRGMPGALQLLFPLANAPEIALVCLLNRPRPADWVDARSRAMAVRFLITGGLVAPALSALVAGTGVAWLAGGDFVATTVSWFAADALGMVLFAPLFHYLAAERAWRASPAMLARTFAPALAMVAAAGALFVVPDVPLLFLVLAAMVIVALATDMATALLAVLSIALTAVAMFQAGWRIQAAPQLTAREQMVLVQVFLATVTHLSHWICAINADRRGLIVNLTEREAQLRQVMDNIHDLFIRLDPGFAITYLSPAAHRLLEADAARLIGTPFVALVHEDDRDRVMAALAGSGEGDTPHVTFRLRRARGDHVECEARFQPLRDEQGRTLGYVTSARDVRDRLRNVELERAVALQLEQRNRLFERAETLAQLGHWSLDVASGRIVWSQGMARIAGNSEAIQPTLESTFALIHPDDREGIVAMKQAAMVAGRNWSYRTRILRTDGTVRFVAGAGGPIRDNAGIITEYISIMLDITDEVETHAALTAARDEARASTEAKARFLATMSHEIRTPMTGVLGMIELLRDQPERALQERYLDNLEASTRLLMRVLDDVLDFSRIEAGGVRFEVAPFDLAELFARTVELYRPTAAAKRIGLGLRRSGSGPTRLVGDAVRIQQVVANLLANALKFTSEGGVIVSLIAGTASGRPGLRCEVADTGIGIPLAEQDAIFEPFAQADAATTRQFGGTGLGLAIARQLIGQMGGSIGVHSIPGHGSTFWFELELPAAGAAAPLPTFRHDQPTAPLRILLAEDNAVTQLLVEALLHRAGHAVTVVGNGREAVAAAEAQDFDAILMDMQMPVMDGIEATRAVRTGARNRETPIIAVTADISPGNRARYEGVGLTDFLAKPIDSEALAARLRGLPRREAAPPVDPARIAQLAAAVGQAKLDEMLALLAEELDARPREIARLAASAAFVDLAAAAHSLKGMAASLGAGPVTQLARDLEAAARVGDSAGVQAITQAIVYAAQSTRDWLATRLN